MFLPGAFRRKIRKPAGSKGRWKSRSQCKLSPWLFVLVCCYLYDEISHTATGKRLLSGDFYGSTTRASLPRVRWDSTARCAATISSSGKDGGPPAGVCFGQVRGPNAADGADRGS